MSDFRFPGRWLTDRRIMSLAGDDFRAYVTAGAWMVENRTDGHITNDDLDYIPRFTRSSVENLVTANLWVMDGNGWTMPAYRETQTSKAEFEVLENARRADREKKARQRAAKKNEAGECPGDNSRDRPPDYTGKDRLGKDRKEGQEIETIPTWHVAPIPDADPGYCTHGVTVGVKCRSCPGLTARTSEQAA